MKKVLFLSIFILLLSPSAQAQSNPFETVEQSRQRHSYENYQYYKENGVPLGGYPDKLGDPAPYGTDRPGYNGPKSYSPYESYSSNPVPYYRQ